MGLARKNDFDKDFVMKCCLVLCDLPVKYGVQNFTSENLAMIEARWPGIQSAIKRAVELANRFGIDRETLTSANALVPIVYWFYQRPKLKLMEGTPYSARNGSLVRSWLVMALLSNVFSGSSDTMLQAIREELKKHGDPDADFPK